LFCSAKLAHLAAAVWERDYTVGYPPNCGVSPDYGVGYPPDYGLGCSLDCGVSQSAELPNSLQNCRIFSSLDLVSELFVDLVDKMLQFKKKYMFGIFQHDRERVQKMCGRNVLVNITCELQVVISIY